MGGIGHVAYRRVWAGAVAGGVLASSGLPLPAFGQAAPQTVGIPSRDDLRSITQAPPTETPQLNISGGIERSPCPLADDRFKDIKVTIGAVDFHGLKGADASEMETAWKPFAGAPQPIAVLCEVRDAAATILRNKGYLAAVQVPTQRIEDGKVRMEVLYARVTAIRARGDTRGAERKLEAYLNKLTEDEIFDRNKAERYLLLARDLPGYNVQLTLRPAGTGVGELIGEVSVTHQPYTVDLTLQNLAPHTTGPYGGQVRAQVFGLTGLGDVTTLSYYATSDFSQQHILQGSHEFRPGSEGLVLGAQVTHAWTKPDLGAAAGPVTLKARTLYAGIYARYPLVRTQAKNLYLTGGFDFLNQKVDLAGVGALTRDRLRIAYARLDFDTIDLKHRSPRYRFGGSLEVRQGLNILDATPACAGACPIQTSRPGGSASETVVRAQASLEYAAGQIAIAVLPRAQYAFNPLLSFEQFSLGNYTVGRGFDPGTLSGDSGVGTSVEVRGPRYPLFGGGRAVTQPYVFGDVGWTFLRGTPGSQRLTSAGAGLRTEIGSRYRLDGVVAVPIERAGLQTKRGDVRMLVTLTARLLPWRTN
ncbi:MAG: ShlB/FhaC/HecB family hemolysin secretion/activation protein [Novosphingobium sp.]